MWALLVAVALSLVALYYLPERIGSWELKPLDILSELRLDTLNNQVEEQLPSLTAQDKPSKPIAREDKVPTLAICPPKVLDTVAEKQEASNTQEALNTVAPVEPPTENTSDTAGDIVGIEDYSASHRGLARFFSALTRRESLGRPVRIAILGDSFIEGDIFTAPLRNRLQAKYGGGGVGWMPMSSNTAGFRTSVRHEASGWSDKSVMSGAKDGQTPLGHYFVPQGKAYSRYTMTQGTKPFDLATLYYTTDDNAVLSLQTQEQSEYQLSPGQGMQAMSWDLNAGSTTLRLNIPASKSLRLYGIALEQREGISLDNISLRGSSGFNILSVNEALTQQLFQRRGYDLIVLQYGLNVASNKQTNYSNYAKTLKAVVEKLRRLSPESDMLIMSVSDRANKTSQGIETMKAIYYLHQAQQAVAQDLGCTFWSTLRAMQQLGGIAQMAKRGEAAKDYTHLTHKGGQALADLFIHALNTEQLYYETNH